MKRFLLIVLLLITAVYPSAKLAHASDIPTQVRVVANQTYVYKQASVTSEIVATKCVYGTVLNVKRWDSLAERFYEVYLNTLGDEFNEEDTGYVLKAHVIDNAISSPKKLLDYNAVVKSENAVIYQKEQNAFKETSINLIKDTKVRILDGYDKNKQFTYISFLNEDSDIVSYYIKTSDLYVKGINYSIITAVSIMITCLIIISIFVGFSKKKKIKQKN